MGIASRGRGSDVYKRQLYACVDAALTLAQNEILGTLLGVQPYTSLADVRAQFEAKFPDAPPALINSSTLEELGFEVNGALVVRSDIDLAAYFGQLIDGREVFGITDADLTLEVMRHEVFKSELNKRIRAYKVIEYLSLIHI